MTTYTRNSLFSVALKGPLAMALILSGALSVSAEPVRTLPAPPGKILDLRANAAGDLYVRTATNVFHLPLHEPDAGWKAMPLDRVDDLSENAGREVFARQDLKSRFAFHRLAGAKTVPVATTPHVPWGRWYVDALGRVWAQTKERLLVVGKDKTLLDIPARESRFRSVRFQPCEWKPGHLALFFATDIVWASPTAVRAEAAHQPFGERPPTHRLLKLRSGKLAVGSERKRSVHVRQPRVRRGAQRHARHVRPARDEPADAHVGPARATD